MRLLLLEDDAILGEALRDYLRSEGHLVDWCTRIEQARGLVRDPYDAWLIDWNLPDGSGVDWLKSLRARGHKVPALVLTARDQVSDRIRGLEAGADDYLVKPFDLDEMLARTSAIQRRSAPSPHIKVQDCEFDLVNLRAGLAAKGQVVQAYALAVVAGGEMLSGGWQEAEVGLAITAHVVHAAGPRLGFVAQHGHEGCPEGT